MRNVVLTGDAIEELIPTNFAQCKPFRHNSR